MRHYSHFISNEHNNYLYIYMSEKMRLYNKQRIKKFENIYGE